ncbi:H/ACA ribonucleoprotein complex subunit 2-like protein [Phalaenopsis equestris]|uniref:H/ACA ribonucleoprotein complex subunit 2-like protein n=1 Tax=Phalaenopsis equestris TaxID=78828 RepID=UPI0009E57B7B|nr:H/ACA ribonucleoprotein complex subunit 2-like protein [Phalaenopsis equestris]
MGSDSENEMVIKEKKTAIALAPIAKPLASKKLCKPTHKLIRRATEAKCVRRGVKEVVKSIRRGHKELFVIPGNISPIDVITNVSILSEEADIPYIYVPSREDLATSTITKRPTCCILVMTKPKKGELDQEVQEKPTTEYELVASKVKDLTSNLY